MIGGGFGLCGGNIGLRRGGNPGTRQSVRAISEHAGPSSLRCRPSAIVSRRNATSWVVKALVEATPTSMPARVWNTSPDSRSSALFAVLMMARVAANSPSSTFLSAARVSAVSPDCDTVTKSVSLCCTRVR